MRSRENSRPGYFLLSLDVELAWGSFDNGELETNRRHLQNARHEIRHLLALLDRYSVPVTWAFVGHLMLDNCERRNGTTHEDVLRPCYTWYPHDWHAQDPGTDLHRDPLWYGTDILEWVLSSRTPHEIGTHTFSHILVGDPACTPEIALSQFRKCRDLHARYGLEMKSVVFPRNRVGQLDVLPKLGVIAYRGVEQSWSAPVGGSFGRACRFLHRALGLASPTYPLAGLAEGSLVNLPASMFLSPADGVRRLFPFAARRRQAFRGVLQAAERGEIFHLWLHPSNLASHPQLRRLMEEILELVHNLHQEGRIIPLTMANMAREVLRGQERCNAWVAGVAV